MTLLLDTCSAQPIPQGPGHPKRLRVLPRTDIVRGRDGRAWHLGDAAKLVDALNASAPILVDEGHGSVNGTNARAAGWLTDFTLTAEGIEASVEWTGIGEDLLASKAYRYLSPTLRYDTSRASDSNGTLGTIRGLHSVGLVNTPNLSGLTALNRSEPLGFDVQAFLDFQAEHLGEALGVPISYQKHAEAIADGWPLFLKEAVARGVVLDDLGPLWFRYALATFNVLEARDEKAQDEALAATLRHIAPNACDGFAQALRRVAKDLREEDRIWGLLGVNRAQVNASTRPSAAEASLDATDLMICRRMGLNAEAYAATPGERRR